MATTKFEIKAEGQVMITGELNNNILEEYVGNEEFFNKNIKKILFENTAKKMTMSENKVEVLGGLLLLDIYVKANKGKLRPDYELPKGIEVDLLF